MVTVIVVILLAGGACTAREQQGGTRVTPGHRNKQWDIKISSVSLKLMVWADHSWAVVEEGFLCLLYLCLPLRLCWVWSGLQENEQCWHVFISNANIATLPALPCCISLHLLAPACSEIELQRSPRCHLTRWCPCVHHPPSVTQTPTKLQLKKKEIRNSHFWANLIILIN